MKKILIIILAVIATVTCSLSLIGCNKVYSVTFIADGATHATVEVKGEDFSLPEDPFKTNHSFNGWFLDDGVWEQPFTAESVDSSTITENITVYAKFTLNTIEGVTFSDAKFIYDGNQKTIEVKNLPEGASVTYSPSNVQTDAGSYEITATITKDNYEDKVLTATLNILEKEELINTKYLAGKSYGSGNPATYYLCVVEFSDDYTKANLYATKYNTKGKESDYISNATVSLGFTNEGKLRITANWSGDYNWIRLIESEYGGYNVDCMTNSSYWDHIVAKGFSAEPTMNNYTGRYELDLSTYQVGQGFAPTGWTEQVMDAGTGEYKASSGNATIVEKNGEKRIAVTLGENESNVYKYTYMFSETPLGSYSFYKFDYDNSAYVRVAFINKNGGKIYVIGTKSSFFTANASTDLSQLGWISGYGDQTSNIVGVEIEVYAKPNVYNPNNTIEIIPFILSYALEV